MVCIMRQNNQSIVISVRLSLDVYDKLRRLHPHVCAYLRERIEYDVTRKHVTGHWTAKNNK
jgi:hypothetical protein